MKLRRYRARTWLRRWLPSTLSERIPKGRDCGPGRHEWAYAGGDSWHCYHCEQTTHENPYPPAVWARRRSAALLDNAALALRSARRDEEIPELVLPPLLEAQRLLAEAGLLGTDERLERPSRTINVEPTIDPSSGITGEDEIPELEDEGAERLS